jgi:hypothetical protein
MSFGSTRKKSYDKMYIQDLNKIFNTLYFKTFKSSVKYSIPFSEFFTKDSERFVYTDTRGIRFNKLHPEFQQIMREEFLH